MKKDKFVDVTGFENGWFKIKYDDITGYVSGDYLQLTLSKTATSGGGSWSHQAYLNSLPSGANSGGGGSGAEFAALALQFQGVPYVWGGESPRGFDCSGLTKYVLGQFGHYVPHAVTQQLKYGTPVNKSDLQPGDLVFFYGTMAGDNTASHVGFYVGDGQFVHASTGSSYAVVVSSLSSSYYTAHYLTARRLVG